MDSSDIEAWYEKEKDELFADYRSKIYKKKDSKKSKDVYKKKTARLFRNYEKKWDAHIRKEGGKKHFIDFIKKKKKILEKRFLRIKEYYEFRFSKKKEDQ
ncbi:MAG: hypothetical protein KKF44_06565 [Nanoarchaeota archaeon]|nr:hypothetical protein [Nanoarchaeota archaeon]